MIPTSMCPVVMAQPILPTTTTVIKDGTTDGIAGTMASTQEPASNSESTMATGDLDMDTRTSVGDSTLTTHSMDGV